MDFSFEQVKIKYQKLILSWLQQPHVTEWFCGQGLENTIQELNKFLHSSSIFQYWLAFDNGHPFALLLTSSIKPDDELTRWCSASSDAITLDILIGDSNYLGKGLAHLLIQQFLLSQFAHVKEVLIDPDTKNVRAIHVYEKAGFQIIGEFIPSHSAHLHTMMRLNMQQLLHVKSNNMDQKIIDWAQKNPTIKALLLVGSRAQQHMVDELSDYDISIFSDSIPSFINDDRWLDQFAKVWVCIHEHKEWNSQSFPTRLVIFEGGMKVDFSFWPTDLLKQWNQGDSMPNEFQAGFKILVDKEKLTHNLPKHSKPFAPKPTQQMFDTVIQEFWFEAYHVSKYLKRNDLWSALFRMGLLRDHFLLKMIEWNEQARSNWTVLHPNGKNLQSWVCPETREAVRHIFAHFDQRDCWNALMQAIELFRRISTETATKCGFTLSELDRTITEYILNMRERS